MSETVVTFRSGDAAAYIARYLDWDSAASAEDMGVCDGVRRYRVDAALWRAYSRAVTGGGPKRGSNLRRRWACGAAGCTVTALAGPLSQHQRATGHAGRVERGSY